MADDSRQAGAENPLDTPRYIEAMQLIADWDMEGGEYAWLIPRLFRLWKDCDPPVCEN
jgi:hypothetical protein